MRKTAPFSLLLLLLIFASYSSYSQGLTLNDSVVAACDHDGKAIVTPTNGTAPFTYTWYSGGSMTTNVTNGADSLIGLSGGWLYVTVQDSNGLYGTAQLQVPAPFTLNDSTSMDTCGAGNATATALVTGGTPGYTYLWSNGQTTQTATGLSEGSYDVEVTDAAGCKLSASDIDSGGVNIWSYSPITATNSTTPSTCNDGTATITPANGTAPYSYYWQSTPVQTTQTAINLPSGWVIVQVTDAAGCYSQFWVNVPQGASPINLSMSTTSETCNQADGTASISASGGSAPYSYLWSTGATTTSISGLSYGWYTVTVTDNAGCTNSKTKIVKRSTPISLSLSKSNPTCGNSDGSVSASVSGGTTPYSYQWTNGQTTQTASNLSPGYHGVTVTDANGCKKYKYVYISYPTNCFGYITGTVYHDANGDCNKDPVDVGLARVFVKRTTGGYTTTNSAGNYSFKVEPDTFDISQNVPQYYSQVCPNSPSTYNVIIPGAGTTVSGNDFWNQPVGTVHDLRVSLYCGPARPGFKQWVRVRYFNDGNTSLTGTLTFVHDTALNYFVATPTAATYDPAINTATFNLGILEPRESGYITVWLSVPVMTTIGSTVSNTASITPVASDTTPGNNTYTCSRIVTASYDPNNKEVDPEGLILPTQAPLTYTVNFQNTGTDTAFTVVIRDTLDANLNPLTFREGAASHPYDWTLENDNEITFTFNNILLPDSNVDVEGSKGFVMFQVDPDSGLSGGTKINGTASIYFDFNSPILTNNVQNTIDGPLHFDDPSERAQLLAEESNAVKLYPNPATESVTVEYTLETERSTRIELYDLAGAKVYSSGWSTKGEGTHHFVFGPDQLGISSGFYLVKVNLGDHAVVKKLSIRK